MSYTLFDLVLLKDAGVRIDAEDFAAALTFENRHRDFSPCYECGVRTGGQHKLECARPSILTRPDWYAELRRRDDDSVYGR